MEEIPSPEPATRPKQVTRRRQSHEASQEGADAPRGDRDNYAFSLEAMKRTKMLRLTDFYDPQSACVIPDVFETASTIFTKFNDNKDCKAKAGSVEA